MDGGGSGAGELVTPVLLTRPGYPSWLPFLDDQL
ncbi:hypothetical protein C7821_101271 [Streptomyces sp. VMFN-G11Ma]|nr:hypothetical protein C7821_101271 [Streptomyces sp. VMFN-G11Ma]